MVFAILGWLLLATLFASVVGMAIVLRAFWRRLQALERRLAERPVIRELPRHEENPLAGVRVALDIHQDHPNAVFANLLKATLVAEDALVGDGAAADVTIKGEIACNGYADVYYRAELTARTEDETLLTLSEKPPHGDRPANLALELVQRLKSEWTQRERRKALHELA